MIELLVKLIGTYDNTVTPFDIPYVVRALFLLISLWWLYAYINHLFEIKRGVSR